MYKAIIIDDEKSVRNGLQKHFDWSGHGVCAERTFDDGEPALNYLKDNPVDIIITDVRMMHMDGITLSKCAQKLLPEVKIVFISGYADVDYLRDALKMEAVDYILKSIDFQELSTVITKVVNLLDRRRVEQENMQNLERKLEQSMPLIRLQRLSQLLKSTEESEEELAKNLQFLEIPLNSSTKYAILIMRLLPKSKWTLMTEMPEKDRLAFSLVLERHFEEILSGYNVSVVFKENLFEYIAVMNLEKDEYGEELVIAAEILCEYIRTEMKTDITVGISEPFKGLRQIHNAYENACDAISKSYLIGKDIPISIPKYEYDKSKFLREHAEKEITDSILNGDMKLIQEALMRTMADVRTMKDEEEQQNFLLFLLLIPVHLMNNMRPENRGPYKAHMNLVSGLLQCHDLNEQEAMLRDVYENVARHLQDMSLPHASMVVKRIRKIIDEQYMEQLSVTTLAEQVNLTATYLCVLFKESTGKTINEYITLVRLNKAKEYLAQTNIHLYDICYKVGYLSPSYFSRFFKKYTGMTPKQYRESAVFERQDFHSEESEEE